MASFFIRHYRFISLFNYLLLIISSTYTINHTLFECILLRLLFYLFHFLSYLRFKIFDCFLDLASATLRQ